MSRSGGALCVALVFVAVATGACARSPRSRPAMEVRQGWVRYLPGAENTAAYFILVNGTDQPVGVDSVSTPVARAAEWHESTAEGERTVMRPIPHMEIPAHGQRKLEPGGAHLMLIGVRQPLGKGSTVPIELRFSDGSQLSVQLPVREPR